MIPCYTLKPIQIAKENSFWYSEHVQNAVLAGGVAIGNAIVYHDVMYYKIGVVRVIKNISSSTSHKKTPSLCLSVFMSVFMRI